MRWCQGGHVSSGWCLPIVSNSLSGFRCHDRYDVHKFVTAYIYTCKQDADAAVMQTCFDLKVLPTIVQCKLTCWARIPMHSCMVE